MNEPVADSCKANVLAVKINPYQGQALLLLTELNQIDFKCRLFNDVDEITDPIQIPLCLPSIFRLEVFYCHFCSRFITIMVYLHYIGGHFEGAS